MTANINKSAILVCNEDKKNPVEFKWKWGRRGIAYRRPVYIPWRRDMKKLFLGCTHQQSNRKGYIIDRQDGRNPKRIAARY